MNKILTILLSITLVGCSTTSTKEVERPHLYWKYVECEITQYRFNMAVPCLCAGFIRVYNKEYDLEDTIKLSGYKASEVRDYVKEYKTIQIEMYTRKYDSTGEIINRYLGTDYILEE